MSSEKSKELANVTAAVIEAPLNGLLTEAQALFKVLDEMSDAIRKLEKFLIELKAHFPFRKVVKEEMRSLPSISKTNEYWQLYPYAERIELRTFWSLAWEPTGEVNSYRLLLLCEEQPEVGILDENGFGSRFYTQPGEMKTLLKKPLIEADLPTRLKFSEHLIPFINSFKEYLEKCRCAIESHDILPF